MNKIGDIRIGFDGKSRSMQTIESWYVDAVCTDIDTALRDIVGISDLEKNYVQMLRRYLKTILLMKPTEIAKWTKLLEGEKYQLVLYPNKKDKAGSFGKKIQDAFNYTKHRKKELVELAKMLNVKVCPYCNMQYTLFAEEKSLTKLAKFQFDHFYNKEDFPMFSMSLYNLIPSCAVCNQGKSKRPISLRFNPYVSSIGRQFHFVVGAPDAYMMGGDRQDAISVELKADECNQEELNVFDETFHLKALYSRHGDVVQEVYDKVYLEKYYNVVDNFIFLGAGEGEYVKRLFYGTYMCEDEMERRPLAKFIQDIEKQVKK